VRIWLARLGRIGLTLGLVVCAADVARRGVAEWYSDRQTIDGLRHAVRWCPESARYLAALADALENSVLEGDAVEAVRLSEEAARLAPLDARGWARLGAAYEAAGRTPDAGRAFQKAVALFPRSPEMNWRLGNFLLRQDDTAGALAAFRQVVIASPSMRRAAFQTAWGATNDSRQILDRMIPQQPEIFIDYLHYLLDTQRLDAAREIW
jgi:tetratricopeptide (TPR) repeat protein